MTIKLLALDLDHTLLNSEREINETDLKAIREARSTGVVITIATGRMFSAARAYAQHLEIDAPIITYQGSLIRKLLSKEEMLHLRLDNSAAREAISMATKTGVHVNIYDGDKLFVRENNSLVERYQKINRIDVTIDVAYVDNLTIDPTKIVFVENNLDKLNKFQKDVEEKFSDTWNVTRSLPHLLELGHGNATKAKALSFIGKKLSIKRSEVMAIGDGVNDIDMINWAGVGIAMGNAPLEVKRVADWVTKDNDSAGVAWAIRKFILN